MPQTPRHQCLIYKGSPAPHLPGLTTLIQQKLNENYRCLYLNSPAMVAGMRSHLFAAGTDVPKEIMKGSLVLSAESTHLVDGRFNIDRMLEETFRNFWSMNGSWKSFFEHARPLRYLPVSCGYLAC